MALQLIAIEPKIGGLLLSGPRGSAKSTIVRSLASLNPDQPFVTVPLGAGEEMVVGSFDLEKALKDARLAFKPGLLSRAHEGILYVDEVNLLQDHLVDLLLDAAASGVNLVERDGISHQHAAEFSLIGTMNPDEGELRPQLLDRFGLMARVQTEFTIAQRQQVVQQRLAYDRDPQSFIEKKQANLNELQSNLDWARKNVAFVVVSPALRKQIAQRCAVANVEGFRADITLFRASCANAALHQRLEVTEADLDAVEDLVLDHRRQTPPQTPPAPPKGGATDSNQQSGQGGSSIQGSWGAMEGTTTDTAEARKVAMRPSNRTARKVAHRKKTSVGANKGVSLSRRFLSRFSRGEGKIDWFRTLGEKGKRHKHNLKYKFPQAHSAELNLVLLDTSASTLGGQGLSQAKGVIRELSRQAYLQRQQLCILTFGNDQVKTILHPQRAPKNIQAKLDSIRAGGGTPIRKAFDFADNLLKRQQFQHLDCSIYLLTDGRIAQSTFNHKILADNTITIVDIESSRVKLGLCRQLADAVSAQYLHVSSLPLA